MDTTLFVVTLMSTAMALVSTLVAARVLRDERRRSDARVAALARAIEQAPLTETAPEVPVPVAERARTPRAIVPVAWQPADSGPLVEHETDPAELADALRSDAGPASMFASATAAERDVSRRLLPALGIGAAIVAVVGGAAVFTGTFAHRTGAAAAAPAAAQSLELLSLRHETQGGEIAVTGLVRNPAGAQPVRNLSAVVFFFDGGGSFLGSSRAPLDYTVLGAGDESPFVIHAAAPAGLTRYRVSFRGEQDRPVPHVDRRPKA